MADPAPPAKRARAPKVENGENRSDPPAPDQAPSKTERALERTLTLLVDTVIAAREEHPSAAILKCLERHASQKALSAVFLKALLRLAETGDGFDTLKGFLSTPDRIKTVLDAVTDDARSAAVFAGAHDVIFAAAEENDDLAETTFAKAALGAGSTAASESGSAFVEGVESLIGIAQHNAKAMREAAACVENIALAVKDERAHPCVNALVMYSLRHHMKCSCEKEGDVCPAYEAAADTLKKLAEENIAGVREQPALRNAVKVLKRQEDAFSKALCAAMEKS